MSEAVTSITTKIAEAVEAGVSVGECGEAAVAEVTQLDRFGPKQIATNGSPFGVVPGYFSEAVLPAVREFLPDVEVFSHGFFTTESPQRDSHQDIEGEIPVEAGVSLVFPISGPDATLAYSTDRRFTLAEAKSGAVRTETYGVGRFAVIRQKLRVIRGGQIVTAGAVHHLGFCDGSNTRYLMSIDCISKTPITSG